MTSRHDLRRRQSGPGLEVRDDVAGLASALRSGSEGAPLPVVRRSATAPRGVARLLRTIARLQAAEGPPERALPCSIPVVAYFVSVTGTDNVLFVDPSAFLTVTSIEIVAGAVGAVVFAIFQSYWN